MPRHSSLSSLTQFTTVSILLAAMAWLAWHWDGSIVFAIGGALLILFSYSLVLALEFVALYFIARGDTTPLPTWREILRAWAGETLSTVQVFCWRMPFRWREVPDLVNDADLAGRRGVVFVHGFVCNRGIWTPWLRMLASQRRAFVAVNLEPLFGSIDGYSSLIDDAVLRVTNTTGMPPVLVCHSMGGLAARAWLRSMQADERVAHIITIASPHGGTWLGRFSHLPNGRQMRIQSEWLNDLGRNASAGPKVAFTCWYSNCDNIVFPTSTATLAGADNRLVRGVAHVDLAFDKRVMRESLECIACL